MPRLPLAFAACAAVWAALGGHVVGCSNEPNAEPRGAATDQGYDGPVVVAVDPPAETTRVPVDKVIRVQFSAHLDPSTISGNTFQLYSGPLYRSINSYYDPVRQEVVLWGWMPLRKHATWVLDISAGLTGIDGKAVAPGRVTYFQAGEYQAGIAPFGATSFESEILPIFAKRCASCHGGQGRTLANLKLDSAAAVAKTAVGQGATGWPGWRRIAVSSPGGSYLLYKVLGDRRIAGLPMPRTLDGTTAAALLSHDELRRLSDWIASGARFVDALATEN